MGPQGVDALPILANVVDIAISFGGEMMSYGARPAAGWLDVFSVKPVRRILRHRHPEHRLHARHAPGRRRHARRPLAHASPISLLFVVAAGDADLARRTRPFRYANSCNSMPSPVGCAALGHSRSRQAESSWARVRSCSSGRDRTAGRISTMSTTARTTTAAIAVAISDSFGFA
jgi:hypothetical protein